MAEQTTNGIFRFAAFEADLRRGELRKHGLRIKLQDQPFKVLAALLENPGEVIGREELRQRIWGTDTFVDFNRGLSSAVNRLRDALGDSAENPRYIETVARKGYRFIAPLEAPIPSVAPPTRPRWPRAAVVVIAAACLAGLGLLLFQRLVPPPAPRLEQVTALIGSETMPSFSPDGRQLAFVWTGEQEKNSEVYVQSLGTATPLRLTNHPGADLFPSWSPDGRHIAFFRIDGATALYLISPFGGPERKLLELPGRDRRTPGPETRIVGDLLYPIVNRPSWTPDSRWLVITRYSEPPQPGDGAVLAVPVDGSAPRTVLTPQPRAWYRHATLAPDGRRLAVVECVTPPGGQLDCLLKVHALAPDLQPTGKPLTILSDATQLRGIAWAPDGESLIVAGFRLPRYYCWRVAVRENARPERIELAGVDAIWPAFHPSGRLAFSHSILQADLWRYDLGGRPVPFLSSTARDTSAQLSPDGSRVAFQSARGGTNDIWMARTDGSELRQVTRNFQASSGSPFWSPDGKRLAFDASSGGGRQDVWVVAHDGGAPRRVTDGPGVNGRPSWSHDGRYIYFSSNRSGRFEVWRAPAEGGAARQVTRQGGYASHESPDGKTLFYTKTDAGNNGIFALALAGGPEKNVVPSPIVRGSFDAVPGGLYYITPRDFEWCELRFLDLASGRVRVITPVERPVAFSLSASPDQRTFVYSRPVTGADLMLIDNFR